MQYATSCNAKHRLLQTTDRQHITLKSIWGWHTNLCILPVYNLKKCKEYATKKLNLNIQPLRTITDNL